MDYKTWDYDEERIHFTATIKVPAGFIIASLENYSIELLLDQSDLHQTKITTSKPSYVPVGSKEEGSYSTLSCFSKLNKLNVYGSIKYNVVAKTFKPAKLLQGESVTSFTASDTLVVDMDLGYKCYGNLGVEQIPNQFTIRAIKHTEFLIDETGEKISFCKDHPHCFFNALSASGSTQTICVPYTLIIKPLISTNPTDQYDEPTYKVYSESLIETDKGEKQNKSWDQESEEKQNKEGDKESEEKQDKESDEKWHKNWDEESNEEWNEGWDEESDEEWNEEWDEESNEEWNEGWNEDSDEECDRWLEEGRWI